jgi:type IX secretion system PorP/SprF family membrane protein
MTTLKNHQLFLIFATLVLVVKLPAQDIHFSQFDVSPTLINPAATGVSNDADFRFVANYKNQWSSVSSVPYSTMAGSYDMSLFKNKEKNAYLGVGISAFSDVAGKSKYGMSQYNFNISGIQKLNEENILSAGLMAGYAQYKANLAGLSWDNQWNGEVYDPNLATGENTYGRTRNFIDIGTGLLWQKNKGDRISTFGASVFHPHKPNKSLNGDVKDKINPKMIFHGGFDIKLPGADNRPDRYLHPKIMYVKQGPHSEIVLGTFLKYVIQSSSRYTTYRNAITLDIGGFYRVKDAIVFATSFDYGNIRLGMSYDVNVSKLRTASYYQGGIEFSLVFKGIYKDSRIRI